MLVNILYWLVKTSFKKLHIHLTTKNIPLPSLRDQITKITGKRINKKGTLKSTTIINSD